VSRIALIFGVALLALMAGALFYAAKLPVVEQQQEVPASTMPEAAAPRVVSYPEFTLPDISGTERDFSEWQGKHRLINFWATWCAPCRREIPLLKTFQDEHAANGYQVVGIAVDYPEGVSACAETAGFNYPVLVGQQDAMSVAESSGIEFIGMPFTMIVAADGEYLSAYIGELHQPQLDSIVAVLTRLDRGEIDRDGARAALDQL
jgi:thiol-disulfide isomerase/thioredoxin